MSILLLLTACGGSSNITPQVFQASTSSSVSSQSQEPDPRVINDTISSSITGITYPIHIYLPRDYDLSTKNYPVIYATDGQWIFGGFSQAIKNMGINVILVAIEQGPDDRRAIDYLLPGAETYFHFFITELLPYIENNFRVDPENRSIQGASYGGLFVSSALLMDDVVDPLFKNYLCFDGSFFTHSTQTANLEAKRYSANQEMNVRLILTSALISGNDSTVTRLYNTLKNRNYTGLNIFRDSYNVHHNDVAQPSFEYALNIIF